MAGHPNIYSGVVFDLHKKVKEFLDRLNDEGQIDLDDSGYPHLIKIDRDGANFVVQIARNGKIESFILNSRKKAEPVVSWDSNDGFIRQGGKKVISVDTGDSGPRRERERRTSFEAFERLTNQIITG